MTARYFTLPNLSVLAASRDFHPFTKTRVLLDDYKPGKDPVNLTIGEPQNQPPAFMAEAVYEARHTFNKYAPTLGSKPLLAAQINWLKTRFDVPELDLEAAKHVVMTAGSREGITMTLRVAVELAKARGIEKPKILIPNPFYHTYAGAGLSAGGEIVAVNAEADQNFEPDFCALPDEIWSETAAVILCSPANPQGAVASKAGMKALVDKCRQYGAVGLFDECYNELYRDTPPPSALELVGADLSQIVVTHSLSKRSSAAGIRVGFLTGDAAIIEHVIALMKFTSATVAAPIMAGALKLLEDEEHVIANRARYNACFDIAKSELGAKIPDAGFCLWLPVQNDIEAALKLWRDEGIRTLPGSTLGWGDGPDCRIDNPGSQYLRLALVIEPDLLPSILQRAALCLSTDLRL